MTSDFAVRWVGELELFFIRDNLIAATPGYQLALGWQSDIREVKHFYCSRCGEVWGLRIFDSPCQEVHTFHSGTCSSCGGKELMLTGFEWNNLDLLDKDLLAYTLYQLTDGGHYDENRKSTI